MRHDCFTRPGANILLFASIATKFKFTNNYFIYDFISNKIHLRIITRQYSNFRKDNDVTEVTHIPNLNFYRAL